MLPKTIRTMMIKHLIMSNSIDKEKINNLSKEDLLKKREDILQELKELRENKKESIEGKTINNLIDEKRTIEEVIYEVDDRIDIKDVTDVKVLANSNAVVALIRKNELIDNGDGTSRLITRPYGPTRNLCKNENFYTQPFAPFCSGILTSNEIIATAAHCIDNEEDLQNTRFVFGFKMINDNESQTIFKNSDIYQGKNIIKRVFDENTGSDWVLVKLKERITNIQPVSINRNGKISNNEDLYVIGHPNGLPMKYADGARVRDNTPNAYFVANLDTLTGNSGSPVFNKNTHQLEGLLVRGERDFEITEEGCKKSNICPNTGCRGEDCTRVAEFIDLIV